MDLERFLLDGALGKNIQKIDELYHEIYSEDLHTGHPMELYRYIDLQMDKRYEIFTISDLHADVRRFLTVLKKAGFINSDVNMANPIKNVRWNPEMQDKIIVICGDIIDGKRDDDNDYLTNCDELLIHMLIFNLRILARAHNSYVFCTMGNHDFFAFHTTHRYGLELAYSDYIDSRSADFYLDKMNKT
jgi:predicted MPP superfamily phosphohydrolase